MSNENKRDTFTLVTVKIEFRLAVATPDVVSQQVSDMLHSWVKHDLRDVIDDALMDYTASAEFPPNDPVGEAFEHHNLEIHVDV